MKQDQKQNGEQRATRVRAKDVLIGLSLLAILVILSSLAGLLPELRRPSHARQKPHSDERLAPGALPNKN